MPIEVYIGASSHGPVEPYQPQPVAAPGNVQLSGYSGLRDA